MNSLDLRNDAALETALRTLRDRETYTNILQRQSPPDPRAEQLAQEKRSE